MGTLKHIERDIREIFNFANYGALCFIRAEVTPDEPLYFMNKTGRIFPLFMHVRPTRQEITNLKKRLEMLLSKYDKCLDLIMEAINNEMRELDNPTSMRGMEELLRIPVLREAYIKKYGEESLEDL